MELNLTAIERYLQDRARTPFFLFAERTALAELRRGLQAMGLHVLSLSALCPADDRLPLLDDVLQTLKERMRSGEKILLVGLGECLALRGAAEAQKMLLRLKDLPCAEGALVVLIGGLSALAEVLRADLRIAQGERRMAFCRSETTSEDGTGQGVSLTVLPPEPHLESAVQGVRALLALLEKGGAGSYLVQSRQRFLQPLFTVRQADDAFGALVLFCEGFSALRPCGTDEEWQMLLRELFAADLDMSVVFARHGLDGDPAQEFSARAGRADFEGWLYFIALRLAGEELSRRHPYLVFAAGQTTAARDLRSAVVSAIADVSLQDERFGAFYRERKMLLRGFSEAELAGFVTKNRRIRAERLYRLTDGTEVEREDVLAALSRDDAGGYDDWKDCAILQEIYPALAAYAADYVFKGCARADELTKYFIAYKRQKLSNCIEEDFLRGVEDLAVRRIYNDLPAREALLEAVPQEGAHLFWLDALGVEYLGLITACAKRLGLRIRVQVGRAMLPTITCVNRAFFDEWRGTKEKDARLDDLKHGEKSRYNYTEEKHPIHLAREIAVIEEMMQHAATQLAAGNCRRFVIASDHGASRLAVRREQEEKYPTDTGGEHSGRCCRMFAGYAHDLPFATEEGGYLVLADYGRLRGSRKASVEVHGGASLEEVLVPLITLEKQGGAVVHVSLADEKVTADRKAGVRFALFADAPLKSLGIVWQGRFYAAERQDAQHFMVQIAEMRHAGTYRMDVYAEDALLDEIELHVESKGIRMNDDFDF